MTAQVPTPSEARRPAPTAAAQAEAARRKQALIHLKQVRDELGCVPGDVKREVAEMLSVHPEHLSRMLRHFCEHGEVAARPGSTRKKTLPDVWEAQVAYFY